MSWFHGLIAGDPEADSQACLTCHKMPKTAFNSHGATFDVLLRSTKRLRKIAAASPEPLIDRVQTAAFPMRDVVARGLYCATCHQEHQGVDFDLGKISNEQCRSCHVLKFNSFDHDHPKFENYPFKRRTRVIYDHAAHFGKHYPELAKKEAAKQIPKACATCHKGSSDRQIMSVAPFDQTCARCHLDQITGKERATGPKGIAFLTLPGLDVQTLRDKQAPIGEWPDSSEAELTPFMKVMISRSRKGKELVKRIDALNLHDLSKADAEQITAVTTLVREIKKLFYALISGKASDVLGDLNIGNNAKLSPTLVADLTASIPRDVVIRAQQQWLPNLAQEMAGGPEAMAKAAVPPQSNPDNSSASTDSNGSEAQTGEQQDSKASTEATPTESEDAAESDEVETAKSVKRDPPTCSVRVLGQCLMFKEPDGPSSAASEKVPRPSSSALPDPMRAGLQDVAQNSAPGQTDDLLSPTPEEAREINARMKGSGGATQADADKTPSGSRAKGGETSRTQFTPTVTIESDIDPESWAEYGGWYQQDYAISYRPKGHKDKFLFSWLFLTGPQSPKGAETPVTAVFESLTGKDAQGSCTKCHSVDDIGSKGRVVNFSPATVKDKQGGFTRFVHEPHFGMVEKHGCLTCHELKDRGPYLKSYEQGNPQQSTSNFGQMKAELCQSCHRNGKARQDCLTCHKYHVNGVTSPITNTKLPVQ